MRKAEAVRGQQAAVGPARLVACPRYPAVAGRRRPRRGGSPPARVTSSGWAKAARREIGGPGLGVPQSASAEFFRPLDRYTQWWEASHERLIAASGSLLVAQGPRALEQATAELVGAELYNAVRDKRSGLRFDTWAMELVARAAKRMVDTVGRDDDSWRGPGGCCMVLLPSDHTGSAVIPGNRHRRQRPCCPKRTGRRPGVAEAASGDQGDRRRACDARRVRDAVRRDGGHELSGRRRPVGVPDGHRRQRAHRPGRSRGVRRRGPGGRGLAGAGRRQRGRTDASSGDAGVADLHGVLRARRAAGNRR
jgi:hypothetical protein